MLKPVFVTTPSLLYLTHTTLWSKTRKKFAMNVSELAIVDVRSNGSSPNPRSKREYAFSISIPCTNTSMVNPSEEEIIHNLSAVDWSLIWRRVAFPRDTSTFTGMGSADEDGWKSRGCIIKLQYYTVISPSAILSVNLHIYLYYISISPISPPPNFLSFSIFISHSVIVQISLSLSSPTAFCASSSLFF